jgi:Phage capsid family
MAEQSYFPNTRSEYVPPRKRLRGRDLITRAATAELLRVSDGRRHEDITDTVRRIYGRDEATLGYLERAVTNPANSTTATWAAELVDQSVADFLVDMERQSAFAALAQQGAMNITLGRVGSIKIPGRASPITLAGAWILEGGPKPVAALSLTTALLTPYKVCTISVFSEELLEHSIPSIETVVTEALRHDLGAMVDSALLDSAAVSTIRPAGLFNGVTPLTASVVTPPVEAMAKDLAALAGAVSASNPDARIVYLANTVQAARLVAAGYPVIATGFLAVGTVAAVDAGAIALTASPPTFALSRDAVIHMETAPLPIATGAQGSGVLATPTRSMFQEDHVAIRSTLRVGWIRRRTGCTAIVNGATW